MIRKQYKKNKFIFNIPENQYFKKNLAVPNKSIIIAYD